MELLEQHFDTAFAAPDGIAKLRELILTLAMQGKLIPQDPNDPPASELLKKIEAEKQRLVKAVKIKQPKPLPPIKPEEMPYELPQGWEWVRLGDIVLSITGGGTPSKHNPAFWGGDIPWASVKDLNVDIYLDSTIDSITGKAVSSSSTNLIPKGSIIVCTRMGLGKIAINRVDVAINQDLKALTISNHVDQMFFLKKYKNYKIIGSGMTVHGIRQDELLNFPFPLPPLPEQHRIVAKIDQLMTRCDELEKLRTDREQQRLAVHTAAIRQLLDAPDGTAWEFIQQHFGELYSVKENVAELRKAILQLAVMGKLVPQDPNDPPARELLKEIEAEKRRLVKASKIKAPKHLPPVKPDEVPYELPQGWEWVRFFVPNTVRSELVSAKDYPDEHQIAPDSIEKDTGRLLFHRTVEESGATGPNNRFYKGQILYSKIRPSLNKVVVAPYGGLCSADMYPIICHIDTFFMLHVILSEPFLVQVRLAENRVKMPKLNLESLSQFVVPLPPLFEQRRIVTKIDQLMVLCDTLDQRIDAAIGKQTELLNAVMAQV